MNVAPPHHIIAIGASAGGLEEINNFFDHTPVDGVSYVIVQHLSVEFKSRMSELLSRHSKLEVIDAKNGMPVNCNKVYLIPNDKFMTIHQGQLYLAAKENVRGPHLTINTFFNALASDCAEKAIAVILSGLGSDGTAGAVAIKAAGGMVIVRDPSTTQFSSMPAHAIATGIVDLVLEPALIPKAIEDYVNSQQWLREDVYQEEAELTAIIDLIKQSSAYDFSEYKQSTILRRTKRRAASQNFTSLGNYLSYLKSAPKEIDALAKEFLISVTHFFRDTEAFTFLKDLIFPDIISKLKPGEELKLWIPGCATGEEVYAMAMVIAENLKDGLHDTVVKIFATDIDTAALKYASKGIYPDDIKHNVPAEMLNKYFHHENGQYRIHAFIRKMVIFARHDLVKNPPYCNMHLISCRNLLIYMTTALQEKILSMLLFGLQKNGYLFLGPSEHAGPIIRDLEMVNKKWKIYKNLQLKRGAGIDAFSLPEMLDIKRSPAKSVKLSKAKDHNPGLSDSICQHLALQMNALVITVNEQNQVIKSYGEANKYLQQKLFTSDLTVLLPRELHIAFDTLRNEVLQSHKNGMSVKSGSVGKIRFRSGDQLMSVSLTVSLLSGEAEEHLMMVTIAEDSMALPVTDLAVFNEKKYLHKYTTNLEGQARDLQDKLESAYERLDASNENMQSFSEELISANEEMQSTNEEMQSVNEELHTINAEYQLKNKELSEINDDLNNYFRSNLNGQLFINNDLLLMKFSPGAVKQINLLETDLGRPLSNLSTNIKFVGIIADIELVILDGQPVTKEIETNNGKWYQMMVMPYVRQSDQQRTGVVITFNDITELKNIQRKLDNKNKSLLRINADLDNFIHAASHDLLAPLGTIETSINMMNLIALSDKKLIDFLNMINESIGKFRGLITDIAIIAKVESETSLMEMVDIDELLNNIQWSLDDKIIASGASIIRDIEVKTILFSKKNLRSILFNMIANSLKFKRELAPVVHIQTSKEDGMFKLSVQDNGKGIHEGALSKIFDMYGRLNQDIEGSGIGLYLAKKIVNASGGHIQVDSEPGKGTLFSIYLDTEKID